jgi:hypothetical protein
VLLYSKKGLSQLAKWKTAEEVRCLLLRCAMRRLRAI